MTTVLRAGLPVSLAARAAGEPEGPGLLTGYFARFNEWTRISSYYEGDFLERIAPGAFLRTMAEDRNSMRCLFQHGHDPFVGEKPLGPILTLLEDEIGAFYEVPLLDAGYTADLAAGLRASVYGASFRFRVMREEYVKDPGASEHNPQGLPERTVLEAKVLEFGPVTFPAYKGASAGVRSATDWYRSLTDVEVAA